MDGANIDLAKLAVIGNVGDMMAREKCGLVGPVRDIIVEDGVRHQSVEVRRKDLNCYGTATRRSTCRSRIMMIPTSKD